MGTGLLARGTAASAQQAGSGSSLTAGDAAILQFLAAGEALEADSYTQYNELGGIRDSKVTGGSGNRIYTEKLRRIDRDFSQYLRRRDEPSEFPECISGLEGVRTRRHGTVSHPGWQHCDGSSGKLRLTNLMQLTVDTSWWTRYRSNTNNPDVNPTVFEQAVPDLHNGKFKVHRHSEDRRRPAPARAHSGHCQHRGLPYPDRGTRWKCYDSSSAWGRLSSCIFKPGQNLMAMCRRSPTRPMV